MIPRRFMAPALLAAAMSLAAALPARATVGSYAEETGLGSLVRVTAAIMSPAQCARITGKRNGAPAGRAVARDARPVTVVVAMNGGSCGKSKLFYTFQTTAGGKSLIQLFFVSTGGKLLKNEKITINPY